MDKALTQKLAAAAPAGTRRMISGAGHDAMILAPHMPSAMLFLRSPGGISHHPAENVLSEDVDLALAIGQRFIESLSTEHIQS
jgi:allantoate deiminase